MKKLSRAISVMLCMMMVISVLSAVFLTAEASEQEIIIYSEDFESFTDANNNPFDGGSKWAGNLGGSVNGVYFMNDENGVDGTYEVNYCYAASSAAHFLTSPSKRTFTDDFTMEFSMNNFVKTKFKNIYTGNNGSQKATIRILAYAEGDYPSVNGRDAGTRDNASLVTIVPGKSMTVRNGADTVDLSDKAPETDKWYDYKVASKVDPAAGTATYSFYMKESTADTYTKIAENLKYPGSDFSKGISTFAYVWHTGYDSVLGMDNVKVYKPVNPSVELSAFNVEKNKEINIGGVQIVSENSIIMYGSVYGDNDEYGFMLAQLGADGNAVGEIALKSEGVTADGKFAVRVIGGGLTSGKYTAAAYRVNGDETTTESAKEITIE